MFTDLRVKVSNCGKMYSNHLVDFAYVAFSCYKALFLRLSSKLQLGTDR